MNEGNKVNIFILLNEFRREDVYKNEKFHRFIKFKMEEQKIISALSKLKTNPDKPNSNDNLSEISKTIAKKLTYFCKEVKIMIGNVVDMKIDGKHYRIVCSNGQTLNSLKSIEQE